jgi:Protein of unknown function (DUF3638)
MSSSIKGVGVDFNNPTKPVLYKKLYKFLISKMENSIEFAHQIIKHPSWHPDKNPSLRSVMPILRKNAKELKNHDIFDKLSQIVMTAVSNNKMGFQNPYEALAQLKKLAEREDIPFSEKNIANFFGDVFLDKMLDDKNTFYEGNSLFGSLQFITNLLKSEDAENLTNEIQQEFNYCLGVAARLLQVSSIKSPNRKEMREYLTDIIYRDIAKLETGDSVLLPIGWIDLAAGHAMLLKIQRTEDGKFEMLVFNTGDGLRNHQKMIGHSKTYYNPVIKFEGLTFHELCERNFLEPLFELRTELEGFKSEDIYQGILSRFASKQVDDLQLSNKFITPQRSGTCTARVLMNYIKFHTPSVGYQRLHYRMDKKVLEESLKKYSGKLKQYPQLAKLLKLGAERFARRLLKLEKGAIHPKTIRNALNRKHSRLASGGALSKQEIHDGLRVVNRLLKEVNSVTALPKRTHEKFQTLPTSANYPDVGIKLSDTIKKWETEFESSPKISFGDNHPKPIEYPKPCVIAKINPQEQFQYLTGLVDATEKSIRNGNDNLACIKLTQTLLDFPIDLIPNNKEDCQKLYRIMTRAANSLFAASSTTFADRLVAIYRAYAVGLNMIKQIDPKLGSNPISIRPLQLWKSNFNSLSFFKDVQEKLEETLQFFEKHNKAKSSDEGNLFSFHKWSHKRKAYTDKITLPIPEDTPEFKYLKTLYENIPENKWEKVDEEYKNNIEGKVSNGMTQKEFRISMLWLGSDMIPTHVLEDLKYFHSLNHLAIMTELMMGQTDCALKMIKLPNLKYKDDLSPETFFNLKYEMFNDNYHRGKHLTLELGFPSIKSLYNMPDVNITFTPRIAYTKKYAPEWIRDKVERNRVVAPSRVESQDYLQEKTSCEQSLYHPFKDVNSSILENRSSLIFHANLRHNLSTHLLKGFLENDLDELENYEVRTWFKLSLFHHQSLVHNLEDEPLLATQLLNAFDEAIKTTKWQLNNLNNDEKKKEKSSKQISKKETLNKYLFLFDMKARLLSHIPHLDSESHTVDHESNVKQNYSSSSSSSSQSVAYTSSSSYMLDRNDNSHVEKLRNQLREVIKSEAQKKEENHSNQYLHASIILAITYESYPPRSHEEHLELLKGLYFCNLSANNVNCRSQSSLKDIRHLVYKTVSKHERTIFELVNKNRGILTQLLSEIHEINLPNQTQWKNHHPVYVTSDELNNEYRIDLSTGIITCNGIPLKGYSHVYWDNMYKEAFGEKSFNNAIISSHQNPIKYTIEDNKGDKIHIYWSTTSDDDDDYGWLMKSNEKITRIEKEFEGKLYVFIPGTTLPKVNNSGNKSVDWWPSFMKHPYHKNYSTWLSIDHNGETDVKIVDIKKNEVVASISQDGILKDFSHASEHLNNRVIDLSKTKTWSCLSQFDDPRYISAKQSLSNNTNGNITIDFTRYRTHQGQMMRFTSKDNTHQINTTPRLHWEQDPKWFISDNQEISGFPHFKRFLVVENSEGKRKVILPKLTFSNAVADCSFNEIDCMTIEIDTENNLLPQSTFEFAYCAYHSLMNRQYEQAMVFLKEAHSLQRYTPETLRILGWIVVSEDESPDFVPDALAVRAYAAWLGKDNLYRTDSEKQDGTSYKGDESLYTHYAPPKAWEAYWHDGVYWPDKDAEYPTFQHKVAELYTHYLSVRKAVSSGLRVDSTIKVGTKRAALLHVDEEIFLIDRLAFSAQLRARQRHLLHSLSQNDVQLIPGTQLPVNFLPNEHAIKNANKIHCIKSLKDKSDNDTYISKVKELIKLRTRHSKDTFLGIAPYLYQLVLSENEIHRSFVADILRDCKGDKVTSDKVRDMKTILKYMLVSKGAAKKIDQVQNWNYWSNELKDVLKSIALSAEEERLKNLSTNGDTQNITYSTEPHREHSITRNQPLTFKLSSKTRGHFLDNDKSASEYYNLKEPNQVVLTEIPKAKLDTRYSCKRYEELFSNYPETVQHLSSSPVPELSCQVNELTELTAKQIQETQTECGKLKNKILKIARKLPPKGSLERMKTKLALHGKKKDPITLDDCVLAFIQKNEEAYLKLNSILTHEEMQELHTLVGHYLVIQANAKHYKRIQSAQQNPEEMAKLLTIKRQYDIEKHPELLVFEYFMGYTLREDQVEDIIDFITKDHQGSFPNIFKQRMMGAGKTEVLGTLLALMKADGEHLSIMVAPRSLYATNAQDIKRRSNNLFRQKATTINFSRSHSDFSVNYLAYIKRQLIHTIEDRNFVILPPESLQSLENRYFEAREQVSTKYAKINKIERRKNNPNDNQLKITYEFEIAQIKEEIETLEKPIQLLKSILSLIKQKGVITFDEVDAVLQVRKELNFPIGTPETLHPHSCDLVKELFLIAATELKVDLRGNKQHLITEVNYNEIKENLAKKICKHLAANPEWRKRFDPIFKSLSKGKTKESNQQLSQKLYEYIINPNSESLNLHKLNKQKNGVDKQAVEMVILLKQQINEWLSLAWKKRADEHYGLSQRKNGPKFAIPYIANNTPNENAQFAAPWEMVNRTLQLYLYKGLQDDQVLDLFKSLKEKAASEWVSMGEPLDARKLPTVKKALEAIGCNIMELSTSDISKFSKGLHSGKPEALRMVLDYVISEVIPTYEFYSKQVTNNAHTLSSIGKTLQGYSGTLENIDTLPYERVDVVPDKTAKVKILDRLIKKNNDRVSIVKDDVSFSSIMDSVLFDEDKLSPDAHRFKALIDIGPLFTGISSEKVAKDIADYFKSKPQLKQGVKGVIYWDDKTNHMKFIRLSNPGQVVTLPNTDSSTIHSVTGMKKEELFFYYSHSRITGANAKLQEDAIAVVTFDSQTPIRNWLQGVMRMRQMWQNQRIVTAVPENIIQMIADKTGQIIQSNNLTIQNLVPFADDNESVRQEADILKSVKQKLQNAARQYVMNQMLESNPEKEAELFAKHRSLFVRTLTKSMYAKFSEKKQQQQKTELMTYLLKKYFSKILSQDEINYVLGGGSSSSSSSNNTNTTSSQKSGLIEDLRTIIRDNSDNIPDHITTNISSTWGQESVVVQQQQQTTLQEVDQEQQQEQQQEVNIDLYSMGGTMCKNREEVKWQLQDIINPSFPNVSPTSQTEKTTPSPVVWSFNEFLKSSDKYNHFANLFDESVCVTKNFLNTFENVSCLFNKYKKPLYEVVAIYQPENQKHPWKIMMVSLEEASQFKEFANQLDKKKPPYYMILEPNAEVVKSGNIDLTEHNKKSLMKAILPVLILSGNMKSLSKNKWRPYIDEWTKNHAYLKKSMIELNILQGGNKQKNLYEHSYLKKKLEEHSEGFTPNTDLQFQSILGMVEQDNDSKGLDYLERFTKSQDLAKAENFSKCTRLLKAYLNNGIRFSFEEDKDYTMKYYKDMKCRDLGEIKYKHISGSEKVHFKNTKFNFYPIFDKLLDEAINQAKEGSYEFADELSIFEKVLGNDHFYSKVESLIGLLIQGNRFETAKKFIKPYVRVYNQFTYMPNTKDLSKEKKKLYDQYYDHLMNYTNYCKIFKLMMTLHNAGGVEEAKQLGGTMLYHFGDFMSEDDLRDKITASKNDKFTLYLAIEAVNGADTLMIKRPDLLEKQGFESYSMKFVIHAMKYASEHSHLQEFKDAIMTLSREN